MSYLTVATRKLNFGKLDVMNMKDPFDFIHHSTFF